MSGAGEPRISIFSKPLCYSDKGDSKPQADKHVGENLVRSVWSSWFSLCSRPCLVSTVGASRVSYSCPPASVTRWNCTWAVRNGELQDSSKQGANANKQWKKTTSGFNLTTLMHLSTPCNLGFARRLPLLLIVSSMLLSCMWKATSGEENSTYFLHFPRYLPSNWCS